MAQITSFEMAVLQNQFDGSSCSGGLLDWLAALDRLRKLGLLIRLPNGDDAVTDIGQMTLAQR